MARRLSSRARKPATRGEAACAPAPINAGAPVAENSSAGAPLLTPEEAAAKLGVPAKVLERWRAVGGGPAFVKFTAKTLRYRPDDIDRFIAANVRASTAG